jgi:spermidine dehydrogenase
MSKTDQELGMDRKITRRDLLQTSGLAGLSSMMPKVTLAQGEQTEYPPTKTGLRGSHPGSFEAAHALRDGAAFLDAKLIDEIYDLVVVGAGISGLAAAYYYQKKHPKSKILILENHDDFGGHARRNEFHQGGAMRLSMAGTHNMETWQYSDEANALMQDLGIDFDKLIEQREFQYGEAAKNGRAIFFDEATYGVNKLVTNYTLEWWSPGDPIDCIDEFPLSARAKEELRQLFTADKNVLEGLTEAQAAEVLWSMSYPDFMKKYGGLSDETLQIFETSQHGSWGVQTRALSASEGLYYGGLPGLNLLGGAGDLEGRDYPVAMFPDGNASVARLQVQKLIPSTSPNMNADNVAVESFDYGELDKPEHDVRLRLSATVVNAENTDKGVSLVYFKQGQKLKVNAKHCVMACYHSVIPYLCPTMSEIQREALSYQVKIPMVLTNVLLRSSKALDRLGIDGVDCPGRLHRSLFMSKGINSGGYSHPMAGDGPVPYIFWGSIAPPDEAITAHDQFRASRQKMLTLTLEDYEREVRTVLDAMLGPAGFDVKEDVLAITVNRWPHGYSYEYMELWDDDYPDGQAPHEIARQPFGNIAIANTDAGAEAYTHTAIDQAFRAVNEFG